MDPMETKVNNPAPEVNPTPKRAQLKIFFGAAPGAGKTFAMLQEAQDRLDEGVDAIIGVIETHGRPEICALLAGLDTLPTRTLPYHGTAIEEFDLQAAIARKPQLILIDDLAHANVVGSIHPKRWQDIWDLLDSGIDVYTTLNVQNIESLKDIVAQITGLLVKDTVPDKILQRADELELVDIPPEELILRLKEGKVHVPDEARHSIERFYRKGNLLALRELALRRTADHVDADMQRYMSNKKIHQTWAANERLMVCITPSPESASLIRTAKRLSERLKAPWIAAHVESEKINANVADHHELEEHLRMAERLGAEIAVLPGDVSLSDDLIRLAKERNVTRILVGQPGSPAWLQILRPSLIAQLVRKADSIDIMVLSRHFNHGKSEAPTAQNQKRDFPSRKPMLYALLGVSLATLIGLFITKHGFERSDIAMLFVLGILIIATRHGRWPALLASLASIFSFDFFFTAPYWQFSILEGQHLGTLFVLFLVGIVTGNLAEHRRAHIRLAQIREQRTNALFGLAEAFTRSTNSHDLLQEAKQTVASQFQSQVEILLPDAQGHLFLDPKNTIQGAEQNVAQWAFEHRESAGLGTETFSQSPIIAIPLLGNQAAIGVMVLRPRGEDTWSERDQQHLLETFANQTALALERSLLTERTRETQRQVDREQLRCALLTSVSSHLRSPMSSILGATRALLSQETLLPEEAQYILLETINQETHQLQRLVNNLLEITKLESGQIELHKDRVPLQKLLNESIEKSNSFIEGRKILMEIPEKIPDLTIDPHFMEQVVIQLLENAAKFSPPKNPIQIKAWATQQSVTFVIIDGGSGLPKGLETRIFDKLVKAENPHGRPGAGLGLAICKGIIEAHGGWIQGSNHPDGGAQFLVSIPRE